MSLRTLFRSERESRMRALYKNGIATSQQILATEYGHFPPKGIDYHSRNHLGTRVNLTPSFRDKDAGFFTKVFTAVATLGYVHGKEQIAGSELTKSKKDQSIYLNPLLMGLPGKALGVHFIYSAATQLLSNMSLAGLLAFARQYEFLTGTLLLTTLRHVPLLQIASLPFRSYSDVIGHEHIHILQVHDSKRAKTGFDMDDDYFKDTIRDAQRKFPWYKKVRNRFDRVATLGISGYLLNDVEIQARLHTVMVHGYRRWGRLPKNSEELTAAAIDCGLNAPREIREKLARSKNPAIADFMKPGLSATFMRYARKAFSTDTAELNAAQRAMMDKGLVLNFWKNTLPFMYGHLLELYGDPNGRRKMGFSKETDDDGKPLRLTEVMHHRGKTIDHDGAEIITPPTRSSVPEVERIRYPKSSAASGIAMGV